MNAETPAVVQVKRAFTASAERVFDAWLDPTLACRFLFTTPTGRMVRTDIDARVGGPFVLTDRRDGEDIEHVGEYLEIDRPRRLVFTFAVPKFSAEKTIVNIDIVALGAGCELTLTHTKVLPEWASKTQEGWGNILDSLARVMDADSAS
jgi:uncharacterized protein YndB with AHSA1/START domain